MFNVTDSQLLQDTEVYSTVNIIFQSFNIPPIFVNVCSRFDFINNILDFFTELHRNAALQIPHYQYR